MSSTNKQNDNNQIIDLLFQLGVAYLEKGDYNNSIDKFKKMINLGETNAKVYLNLSKAYILKEQFDEESQRIFEKSLEFESENPVLNVILSQLYLDAEREDEQALKVYQAALKHNPQNADEISSKLIRLSFQKGDIEAARELLVHFMDKPEKISNFLPLYIVNEWKHQGFDRVAQYLKSLVKVHEDKIFYRWLAVNFLQAEKQSLEPFELSFEDFTLCKKYIESINSFDHLLDIYLYPAIEDMLSRHSEKFKDLSTNGIEEYEIFLSENALSNIWEKALNGDEQPQEQLIHQQGDIWKKLKPWHLTKNSSDEAVTIEQNEPDPISQIQNQAEAFMVMRLRGISSDAVSENLSKSISNSEMVENMFVGGFKSNDGFLLFWNDLECPIKTAINFVQQHVIHSNYNSESRNKYQFIIHKLTRRARGKEKSIIYDLQTALSVFQLEREMFYQDNVLDQASDNANYQVMITSALKDKVNSNSHFSIDPIDLSAQNPVTEKNFEIFQVSWDDSLAKIRRGDIQEIGRFKLLKQLHQNQIFCSFKAIDLFLDRLVVVKILNPDFRIDNGQTSIAELFLKEARFLGKFSHPNIAMVYDVGQEHDFCFFAREYIEGLPLTVQRTINKTINIKRTLEIFFNIAQTLKYTHDQHIYHGKLQPNNIFVSNSSDIKLTDFQIASFTVPLKGFQPSSLSFLTYFAPEQIEDNTFDNSTDLFSLGVIMYEMLTDQNPFYDADREKIYINILNKTPQPPSYHHPNLPRELDRVILTAMEKSPINRYSNMGELAKDLMELIDKMSIEPVR